MPIRVKEFAFHSLRLESCAKRLSMDPRALAWSLLWLWHLSTEAGTRIVTPKEVTAALSKCPKTIASVAEALCACNLAVRTADGRLDITPLTSLYG